MSLNSSGISSESNGSLHRTIGNHTHFPHQPNAGPNTGSAGRSPDQHGSSLIDNRFELKNILGEGGMGTVWLAMQFEPVRREVAIKMIRPELVGARFMSRFEAERQTLALMDHVNIAGLLDGGITADGAPYLVMELAHGTPITQYCDTQRLTIPERLRLFIQVCQGVQHAHQKGIIHRDLKPANILVTDQAGQPIPKVIDFGLAKVLEYNRFSPEASLTGTGIAIGTPLYMAPEQMEGRSAEADIRADIYSLGVVLYELLTGVTPLTPQQVHAQDVWEVLHRLEDDQQIKPSQRISESEDQAISDRRRVNSRSFVRTLSGDLDWITLKALARKRDHRYSSISDFMADIERYLSDQPVEARPPSRVYRIRKFVQRNRGSVATSVVVGLVLIGLTVFSILSAKRANQAATIAEERKAQTERSFDLLSGVFSDLDRRADAAGEKPLPTQLAEKLKQASSEINDKSFPDGLVQARLLTELAKGLIGLGQPAEAVELLNRAKVVRETALGIDHEDTLDTANSLAGALLDAGQNEQGLLQAQQVVDGAERRWGADDLRVLKYRAEWGATLAQVGQTVKALSILQATWPKLEKLLGPNHADTLTARNNHAYVLLESGKTEEALSEFRQIVERRRQALGETHLDTFGAISSLASVYLHNKQYQLALEILQPAYKLIKEHQAADHAIALSIMTNLGAALTSAGQLELAKDVLTDAYVTSRNKFGAVHETTYQALGNLGATLKQLKETDKAIETYENVNSIIQLLYSSEHPHYLAVLNHLQGLYVEKGQPEKAIERLEEALKIRTATLPADHRDIWLTRRRIGYTHRDAGQLDKAITYLEEVYRHAPDQPEFMIAPVDWLEMIAKQITAQQKETGIRKSEVSGEQDEKGAEQTGIESTESKQMAELIPEVLTALSARCRENAQVHEEQRERIKEILEPYGMADSVN